MTNYEESAKAYESDYRFAPVGMAVGSFWGGALAAALVAFVMSTGVARGFVPTTIHDNQRVVFPNDSKGLFLGLGVTAVLLVVAISLGMFGRAAISKKKDLGTLWKVSLMGIPVLSLVGTTLAIVAFH